jgi:hypothetical protein
MKRAALLALFLISHATFADVGWRDGEGNPVPDTESQKSVQGFGALLVVTPDEDWEEKWNTPPEVAPQFSGSSTVEIGGKLFILTMFTNPAVDDSGAADVVLDLEVKRPDGSTSTHAESALCFEGEFRGPPHNVSLCATVVGFVGEPTDPAGVWPVQVTVTDRIRNVSVPLSTKFELLHERPHR